METTSTTPAPRTRVYRHCRNPRCAARLKTRQRGLCASCRLAGAWGAGLAFVAGAALQLFGVL